MGTHFIWGIVFGLGRRSSACTLLYALSTAAQAVDLPALPAYQVDLRQTSLSGLSSGGFMAAQFEVAYSNTLVGAGIVAGGPFFCAGSNSFGSYLQNATGVCMHPLGAGPDAAKLVRIAQDFARHGQIDPLLGLKKHRVYLFSGTNDSTVTTRVVDQSERFLELAGVPRKNIKYVKTSAAGHGLITDNPGDGACAVTSPPYINDCGTEQSHDILRHIYGRLNPPAIALSGQIIAFNQREFIASDRTSMSEVAYAYVPASCTRSRCRVHVALHGCQQGSALIGNRYYSTTGYNELADTNRIIVLYPQVQPSDPVPFNPLGCWDFWGYSSTDQVHPNFFGKEAPQLRAIASMLQRLGAPRSTTSH
jgi:poly(3-hydroxybutyrate) depolymerase